MGCPPFYWHELSVSQLESLVMPIKGGSVVILQDAKKPLSEKNWSCLHCLLMRGFPFLRGPSVFSFGSY